jgi:hypothetical protein
VPRVGSTALEEVVPWRWTAGRPPRGQPIVHFGDTTSLVLNSPLPPLGERTHQVWTETVPSHGRPAIELFGAGLWSVGPTWSIKASGGMTFSP